MAHWGFKGHTKTRQAAWHFPRLPMWMAAGPGLTAAARSRSARSCPGCQVSKQPEQQPQSLVVQHRDAKTNNLMLIYPDTWHSWKTHGGGVEPSVFPSEVSCKQAPQWNASLLKHTTICSLSQECVPSSRSLLGLQGQWEHKGWKDRSHLLPAPNNLFSWKSGFYHQRFDSYWVMKHLLLVKILNSASLCKLWTQTFSNASVRAAPFVMKQYLCGEKEGSWRSWGRDWAPCWMGGSEAGGVRGEGRAAGKARRVQMEGSLST